MATIKIILLISITLLVSTENRVTKLKLRKRALQKDHEKPQDVKWMEAFMGKNKKNNEVSSLVNLIKTISLNYFENCTSVIIYDKFVEKNDELLLQQLLNGYPSAYVHGQITNTYKIKSKKITKNVDNKCKNYVLFLADVGKCNEVIEEQNVNKVVVVARSSQWRIYEFLTTKAAQGFMNLLIIAKSEISEESDKEVPFILYTHDLFIDGLGSSTYRVLTSWSNGKFTKPKQNLFPNKLSKGFEGHRFLVSLAHQPPFVIKRGIDEDGNIQWDGREVRLLNLLSKIYNFTTDFHEAKDVELLGANDAVTKEVKTEKSNVGIAGLYITQDKTNFVDVGYGHSQDCAAFISLTSTALPRYRAIMGPFHWSVWLSLTLVYLLAIFPLAFSDKLTLSYLLKKPEEIENMFWYVFGTFTNCFSFTAKDSWNKSQKITTRLLMGSYWIFTIITTACYTGSIIAFVTIPVYPSTVDTVKQLLSGRYQIGTLDKGGWQKWFENSSDPSSAKLLKNIEYLPDVESGLRNTTKAFFWPYAFLGSREQLNYIVRTNFTTTSKRSVLHISSECFVPFGVGLIFNYNSIYKNILNQGVMRALESGLMIKFSHDIEWNTMRSATGKLLQASSGKSLRTLSVEDRALTLDDTQGMFLLLGLGFLIGGSSLVSEVLGGCFKFCKRKRPDSTSSIQSNPRSYDTATPRELIDIKKSKSLSQRLGSIPDDKEKSSDENDIEEEINELFQFESYFGERNQFSGSDISSEN